MDLTKHTKTLNISEMVFQRLAIAGLCLMAVTMLGCAGNEAEAKRRAAASDSELATEMDQIEMDQIEMDDGNVVPGPRFAYVQDSNASFGPIAETLAFTDSSGQRVMLDDLAPNRSVVLVVTRGPVTDDRSTSICPVCVTQTARFVRTYPEFAKRNAEVIVVYPQAGVSRDIFDMFIDNVHDQSGSTNSTTPFPIVFDYDHAAVTELGLKAAPVKPSTFVFGPDHRLKFAYVGESPLERPSIASLLDLIDSWSKTPANAEAVTDVSEGLR